MICGSGKSFIIMNFCKFYYNKRILILLPRIILLNQLYNEFINFGLNCNTISSDIYNNDKNNDNPDIVNVLEILNNNNLTKTHNFIKQSIINKL